MELRRVSGIVLVTTSLASVAVLAHHPATARASLMGLNREVHAAMIAVLGAQAFAYAELCAQLAAARARVRLGAIAAAIGVGALVIATTLDGFVASALIERGETQAALAACGVAVRAFTGVALVALAAAFAAWSLAVPRRVIAVVGVIAAIAPITAVGAGAVELDTHGVVLLAAGQLAWNLGAGAWLIAGPASFAT